MLFFKKMFRKDLKNMLRWFEALHSQFVEASIDIIQKQYLKCVNLTLLTDVCSFKDIYKYSSGDKNFGRHWRVKNKCFQFRL